MHTVLRLHGNAPTCQNPLPCFQHGPQHPVRPLLSQHLRCMQQSSWNIFLGYIPQNGKPIKLNGTIHILCPVLKFITASAAEVELGTIFINAKEAKVMQLTLKELDHPQPPMPIHIDNSPMVRIVPSNVKKCATWKHATFGSMMGKYKYFVISNIIKVLKIL